MSVELARSFITRDMETDMEIIHLYLNKFATEKKRLKHHVLTVFYKKPEMGLEPTTY